MKTGKMKFALILLAGGMLAMSSCRKQELQKVEADLQSESDNAVTDGENASIVGFVTSNGSQGGTMKSAAASQLLACASISLEVLDSSDGFPLKVIIDFGPVNNAGCADGKLRRGKIIAVFTNAWHLRQPGDSVTITTEDYFVNDVQHLGTRYLFIQDSITLRIVAVDVRALFPDGTEARWNCDRIRRFVAGTESPYDVMDDVYEHEGSADGVNRKGLHYVLATRAGHPLVQRIDCKHLVQGILDITPDGKPMRSVDYGDGTCDDQAVVTVDGKTYNITL